MFQIFPDTVAVTVQGVSGSRQWHCRLQATVAMSISGRSPQQEEGKHCSKVGNANADFALFIVDKGVADFKPVQPYKKRKKVGKSNADFALFIVGVGYADFGTVALSVLVL